MTHSAKKLKRLYDQLDSGRMHEAIEKLEKLGAAGAEVLVRSAVDRSHIGDDFRFRYTRRYAPPPEHLIFPDEDAVIGRHIHGLRSIGIPAILPVLTWLESQRATLRYAGLYTLCGLPLTHSAGFEGSQQLADICYGLLNDKDSPIVWYALEILKRLRATSDAARDWACEQLLNPHPVMPRLRLVSFLVNAPDTCPHLDATWTACAQQQGSDALYEICGCSLLALASADVQAWALPRMIQFLEMLPDSTDELALERMAKIGRCMGYMGEIAESSVEHLLTSPSPNLAAAGLIAAEQPQMQGVISPGMAACVLQARQRTDLPAMPTLPLADRSAQNTDPGSHRSAGEIRSDLELLACGDGDTQRQARERLRAERAWREVIGEYVLASAPTGEEWAVYGMYHLLSDSMKSHPHLFRAWLEVVGLCDWRAFGEHQSPRSHEWWYEDRSLRPQLRHVRLLELIEQASDVGAVALLRLFPYCADAMVTRYPDLVERLVQLLRRKDPQVLQTAMIALASLGERASAALPVIAEFQRHNEAPVANRAREAMAYILGLLPRCDFSEAFHVWR